MIKGISVIRSLAVLCGFLALTTGASAEMKLLPRQEGALPTGYLIMCLRDGDPCAAENRRVDYNDQLMADLLAVNAKVNRSIRPVENEDGDVWSVNVSAGDCEDYALTKRFQLMQMGIPRGAMRLGWVLFTEGKKKGAQHVVLVVRTSEGDYALDNMVPDIRLLKDRSYEVIALLP